MHRRDAVRLARSILESAAVRMAEAVLEADDRQLLPRLVDLLDATLDPSASDKGIIITIGTFTAEARREAVRDGVPPIELVDREKLVTMLEELELGLTPVQTFAINHDFFEDFREPRS